MLCDGLYDVEHVSGAAVGVCAAVRAVLGQALRHQQQQQQEEEEEERQLAGRQVQDQRGGARDAAK